MYPPRSLLQLVVANCQSDQRAFDERFQVRCCGSHSLHPRLKQRQESVLPSIVPFVRFAILSLQWVFRFLWPRPLAQGCRGPKQDSATPSTPSYLAFGPGGSAIEVVL